ncbi:sulfatase-like hydrolase/transferase [Novosphingobium lindaniclasticum]
MFKVFLIIVYLLCDYESVVERFSSAPGAALLFVFAALYAMLAVGLLASAFIGRHSVRIVLAALFAAASHFQLSFEWTTAGPMTYQSFVNLYNAAGQIDHAVAQHSATMARAMGAALLLFLGVALPPRRWRVPLRWGVPVPLLALCVLATLLFVRGGEGSRALPPAYPSIAFAGLMAGEAIASVPKPRAAPALPRPDAPLAQDIVLIVDESIAGNYLDIDNPSGVRSGLAEERAGLRITNFGYAAAIHKCSANSNAVLRFGGTPDTYREALASWPSIWSYAKAAGLRTVYIDGQSNGGHLQNMMTAKERREIAEFVQFDGVPAADRDMRIAQVLAAHVNNGLREFIYVNKVGAHFPVADKFPARKARYRPILPQGAGMLLSWTSNRAGFGGTPGEWVRYRNSYRNTVDWNVGTFFDRLLAAPGVGNAAIVYTSDHGQDLHERGNPGNNTHCGAENAAQEEGLVPLVFIGKSGPSRLDWSRHLAANRNRSSAFRIFPTLLVLMGYDRDALRPRYGLPLDEAGHDRFAYNVDFAPLLGKPPGFRDMDVASVIAPPESDYTAAK